MIPHVRAVLICVVVAAAGGAGCARTAAEKGVSARLEQYFREHREVPPAIAEAMQKGHIAAGMDAGQVTAVLGKPLRAVRHGDLRPVEVWTYPGHRLHQGHALPGDGATLVRLVFVDGRLELIEPM